MKDETAGVLIEGFVGLNPQIYSYLVDDNSEHKKGKGVNKNVVATIRHNKSKDVLLNKKCFRHSINSIQSKDHRIGTYEINKISFFVLMIKYASKTMDVMDQLSVIRVNYKKTVILTIIQKSFIVKHIILIFSLIRTAFLSKKFF